MAITIGLDVHKDTIAGAAIDGSGAIIHQGEFDNTVEGIADLLSWANDHNQLSRVGLEPSGGVGHSAAGALHGAGISVVLVPPRLSAREARRLSQRGKSDRPARSPSPESLPANAGSRPSARTAEPTAQVSR